MKTPAQQIAAGKITAHSEYFNEVHNKWMPVPPHWIGTFPREWTHRIILNDGTESRKLPGEKTEEPRAPFIRAAVEALA